MITTTIASPAKPLTPQALPANLPWPQQLPEHRKLRGHDRWMYWKLASIVQPDGFDPNTGKQLTKTTHVVAAPYPEFRAVVRLPKSTTFRDVISVARAISTQGDRSAKYGDAQAVLQSNSGSWYITTAGYDESSDHTEPLPISWHEKSKIKPAQRDVIAIVDSKHWVNFSEHKLD